MSTPAAELETLFEANRNGDDATGVPDGDDMIVDLNEDKEGAGAPTTDGESGFYDNLLESLTINQSFLSKLSGDLLDAIALDIESREGRDKQYEEGLRRTGIGNDAPGGASFAGATKTVHPMITKSAVDFESRAIKEICPPSGPCKDFIPGEPTRERLEKAQRKTKHMNWQLMFQIQEFRPGLEKLLTQLPMGGVQYQRWVYSSRKKRPVPNFVPVDMMIIPFAADDFYSAERRTFKEDITQLEYDKRIKDGVYFDDGGTVQVLSANIPDETLAQKANQKIEGKKPDGMNLDGLRRVYETEMELEIEEDDQAAGPAPYIVRVSDDSRRIVGIVRNWEQQDEELKLPMVWIVEWPFIPWRGSMPIGLAQMIGGLSAAATGALRALLDSAHINNLPTGVKLKGSGQGGQSINLNPGELAELEGTMGADDIRKLVMALPFNEPSMVLYQLLGFLVQEAESVVRTTFEDMAEQKSDAPVGTTLALIEQGMSVMSAIHGRLYASMQKTLEVLHRINKMYITDDQIRNEVGELLARRDDYQGPLDVIPVADPRIFSEVQRFAQMQVVADRAEKRPALYNQRKVEMMILERLKFPNPEQLLVPAPEPKEMNPVNENVAATLGRPIAAFPEQPHLAHIQVHVEYMMSPFFGMLGPITSRFFPLMVPHLVEHITLWYASRVFEHLSAASGQDFSQLMKFKDPETSAARDEAVALAASLVIEEAPQVFEKLPPVIQQAMKILSDMAQQSQAADPAAQGMIAVEQAKGQNQQKLEQQRQQGNMQREQLRGQGQSQKDQTAATLKAADIQARLKELSLRVVEGRRDSLEQSQDRSAEMQREQLRQAADTQRTQDTNQTRLITNREDNTTALTIAGAEIESGEKVALSTGSSIGE